MSVAIGGALRLSEVRARAAGALAPLDDTDPDVLLNIVDAAEPPCLMLLYDDPWLEARTMGCIWQCKLEILALASRVEPGPGVEKLEELVAFTMGRLQADPYAWAPVTVSAPRVFTIGGVPLLGARLIYDVRITL